MVAALMDGGSINNVEDPDLAESWTKRARSWGLALNAGATDAPRGAASSSAERGQSSERAAILQSAVEHERLLELQRQKARGGICVTAVSAAGGGAGGGAGDGGGKSE